MVYLFLANGFEDIEALAPLDILRRGNVEIKTVGVGGEVITSSKGVPMKCDITENEVRLDKIEAIILPGGIPGTPNLKKSKVVNMTVDYAAENNKLICAICAAPSILFEKGLLNGKKATCYPGFEEGYDVVYTAEGVTKDGNFITGKGAGVCIEFGLEILGTLKGKEIADNVAEGMMCK